MDKSIIINFVNREMDSWHEQKLRSALEHGVDRYPDYFQSGVDVWIIQTYLLLKRSGRCNVKVSNNLERDCINIIHRSQVTNKDYKDYFVVSVRADRDPDLFADIEIVQNRSSVWSRKHLFIPHWPQPGLISRNPKRGAKIKNICYFGKNCHISSLTETDGFKNKIKELGCNFIVFENQWWNYSEVDVVLAVREGYPFYLDFKPASKLINSWLAGVPAILGVEAGYRELKKSDLDYIEVNSEKEIIGAVRELLTNPDLFIAMRDHGSMRSAFYSRDRVIQSWVEQLELISRCYEVSKSKKGKIFRLLKKSRLGQLVCAVRQRIWGWQAVQFPQRPEKYYIGLIRTALVFPMIVVRRRAVRGKALENY